MKRKDIASLHTKESMELQKLLNEAKQSLFTLNLDKALGKLKNTRSIFEKRKEIARIATVFTHKLFLEAKTGKSKARAEK